jgi:hypothetical protein
MKTTLLNSSEKFYIIFVLLLFLLLISDTFGQNKKVSDLVKNKFALENIVAGIHSEIEGVRESTIYLVGEYRFIDTEDALIKQLKVEKKSDIKVLIALALYRMNSEKGMKELPLIITSDNDSRVRRMSYAIYNEYLINNSNQTVNAK